MKERYEKDGKVAVLVSPGYGGGWSCDVDNELREDFTFSPEVVSLALKAESGEISAETMLEGISKYCMEKFKKEYIPYGVYQLTVEWVPKGQKFLISEYDGFESIIYLEQLPIIEA